jgi:hypothetical protein
LTVRDRRAWAIAIAVIVAAVVWVRLDGGKGPHYALLRAQFHLPSDVAFEYHGNYRRHGMRESAQGIARFTPAQLDAWTATLDDPAVWIPIPYEFEGVAIEGVVAADALRWRDDGVPAFAGDAPLRWGWLHEPAVYEVAGPIAYCVAAVRRSDPDGGAFDLRGCRDVPSDQSPFSYALAVLDPDRGVLYMHLRGS